MKKLLAITAITLLSSHCLATFQHPGSVTIINDSDCEITARARDNAQITLGAGESSSLNTTVYEKDWGYGLWPSSIAPFVTTISVEGGSSKEVKENETVTFNNGDLKGGGRHRGSHKKHRKEKKETAPEEEDDEDQDNER